MFNNGRICNFSFPESCGSQCSGQFNEVSCTITGKKTGKFFLGFPVVYKKRYYDLGSSTGYEVLYDFSINELTSSGKTELLFRDYLTGIDEELSR